MPGKHYRYQHMISLEISAFLLDRESRDLSQNTIKFYKAQLGIFAQLSESHGVTTIEKITPNVIRAIVVDLHPRFSKGGLHAFGRCLKAFLNWFEEEDEIPNWQNPIRKVKRIGEPNKEAIPGIPPEHIRTLISACGKKRMDIRNRAIIFFLYDTGLRVSELCDLNISDVDLSTGIIQVKHGKGDQKGTAFISTKCKRELLKYFRHRGKMTPKEPLFLNNYKQRLTRSGVATMLTSLCDRAGIPHYSAHDFRRAFTKTTLLHTDVVTTSRLLRHKDISLVMRYAHQNTEDLLKAHEESSPGDHL